MSPPLWFAATPSWANLFPSLLSACASASRVLRPLGFDRDGNPGVIHVVPDQPLRGRAAHLLALELAARLDLVGWRHRFGHFVDQVLQARESLGGAAVANSFLVYGTPPTADELEPAAYGDVVIYPADPPPARGPYTIGVAADAAALMNQVAAAHIENQSIDGDLAGQAATARETARSVFLSRLQERHPDWGFA